MLRFNYISIIIVLLIGQLSCNEGTLRNCNQESGLQTSITKIKYGTSFGYCVGHCWKQIVITNDELEFEKMSREDNEPVNCNRDFTCAEWVPISQDIDLENFFALDEIIGCPDCADGGAEWIEIQTLSSNHKVTFEYMSPPAELSNYVNELRKLMTTFENCN